jgi:hypothetical protein
MPPALDGYRTLGWCWGDVDRTRAVHQALQGGGSPSTGAGGSRRRWKIISDMGARARLPTTQWALDFMSAFGILWRGRAVAGRLICLNSDILRLEVRRNPSTTERERIEDFLTFCAEAVAENAEVLHLAQALQQLTLRVHDALHLASAAVRRADYFLTCDDRLVSRAGEIQGLLARHGIPITVMNPRVFLGLIHPTGGEGV